MLMQDIKNKRTARPMDWVFSTGGSFISQKRVCGANEASLKSKTAL